MIVKLTPDIWYGDKPSVEESLGQVKAIVNVAHSIKKPYWQDLGKLDWDVWYFRMACPDRVEPTEDYLNTLRTLLIEIYLTDRYPLLCHCRAGGHRGPTAAFMADFFGPGMQHYVDCLNRMDHIHPGFSTPHPHRIYRNTVLRYCQRWNEE